MRDARRGGEQSVRGRGWHDRRAFIAKDGHGGKAGARHGDPVDFARLPFVLSFIYGAGIVRSRSADPHRDRSDGGGIFGSEVARQTAREESGVALRALAGGGGLVSIFFEVRRVCGFISI